jgi:tetratricopeptide (TPR) repeat protein
MNKEIVKYLNGQMGAQERKHFEQRLDDDEVLSDELMRLAARQSFKRDLEKEFDTYQSTHPYPGQKIFFGKVSRIAAVILFLIIPSAFIVYYLNTPGHLITAQYMDYPLPGNHRSAGDSEYQAFSKAVEAFNQHRLEEAAILFSEKANNPAMADESNLYAGISLLWMKDDVHTEKAVQYFQEVLSTKNDRNDAARWFLAIARFELGEKEEAERLFKEIAANNHHFMKQQAVDVLERFY